MKEGIVKSEQFDKLQTTLQSLQTILDEMKNEVDFSYELLEQVGEKSTLTRKLEALITNPIGHVINSATEINRKVFYILDRLVISFLRSKQHLVHAVYKKNNYYLIILHEDNIQNRMELYSLLNWLDEQGITYKFPIFFQFVPQRLEDKISENEKLRYYINEYF